MKARIDALKTLCVTPLLNEGLSLSDAEIVFDHLLDEELLEKHSHGFIRMPAILSTVKSFNGNSKIILETKSSQIKQLIAKDTLGLVAAYKATKCAIDTAKSNDIAIISGIGYSGTTGALGYYGRMLASENLIGIISCSSEYAVAPWGGRDAILGTNPIAIAIPNGDSPVISDFATAAMTYGELMLSAKEGKTVPYGVVIDANGNPSNDPNDANNGAQLPMAQHKGYALSLAVEILAGLFIGAKAGKNAVNGSDGIIIFAFKPDLFVSGNQFSIHLHSLIEEIKSSELASGSKEIRIPGEGSLVKIKNGLATNYCEVPDAVYEDLLKL